MRLEIEEISSPTRWIFHRAHSFSTHFSQRKLLLFQIACESEKNVMETEGGGKGGCDSGALWRSA